MVVFLYISEKENLRVSGPSHQHRNFIHFGNELGSIEITDADDGGVGKVA